MKFFLTISVLFFLLISAQLYAQKQGNELIDSLEKEIAPQNPVKLPDTIKIHLLCTLSYLYERRHPDKCQNYAQNALEISQKLNWKKGEAWAYNMLGYYYKRTADYPKSLDCYTKAMKLNQEAGIKKGIGQTYTNIALDYEDLGDYPGALEYILNALKIHEEIDDKQNTANDLSIIGIIHYYEKNDTEALRYMLQALSKYEALNYVAGIANELGNIANIYNDNHDYTKSLEYNFKSLKLAEDNGDMTLIAQNEGAIGISYASLRDYHNALAHSFRAYRICKDMGDKRYEADHMGDIGSFYLDIAKQTYGPIKPDSLVPAGKIANLDKAMKYLTESVNYFKEIKDLDHLQQYSVILSDAQEASGKYKDALESYKQYNTYKDSLFSEDNKIKIEKLQTQRDLDLKNKDLELKNKQLEIDRIAVAKKRNERAFFIGGFLIIGVVIAVLFRNYKRLTFQKNEFERLQAVSNERTRIASDMHDDLGAGLTSIRLLSEVANLKTGIDNPAKSEIEKIVTSAGKLSDNLREIIWTMNTRHDKLEDFIIYVRSYAAGFFDNTSVHFKFNRPEKIPGVMMSGDMRRNIFLCIKEALNNIMKHAHASEVSLSFEVQENNGKVAFITVIQDNGTGIDKSKMNRYGNGLNTMKERLAKFGSVLELESDNGTKLYFRINI